MSGLTNGRHLSDEEAVRALLVEASVRVTSQRVGLAQLLFCGPHRHVIASELHLEAVQSGHSISLATVYNTLGQFVRAGLLREVTVNADSTYFDTNIEPHGHAYDETTQHLYDVALPAVSLPAELDAAQVQGVEVLFRVRSTPS